MNPTITVWLYHTDRDNKWEARINTEKEIRTIEGRFDTELLALRAVIAAIEKETEAEDTTNRLIELENRERVTGNLNA